MYNQLGKYYIENGRLMPRENLVECSVKDGILIYEVLRLMDGIPLFWEDHLQRFLVSCRLSAIPAENHKKQIEEDLDTLIRSNQLTTGNIKLLFCYKELKLSWKFYFIPYKYPIEEDYNIGVPVGILHMERVNPMIKTVQQNVRGTANDLIQRQNLYEVLLVDSNGYISEGSRSNLFFILGETIFTPPASHVLPGITRQKVIQLIQELGYDFREEPFALNDLEKCDTIFLTGTSPKVISVKNVESRIFQQGNEACLKIKSRYDQLIQEYLDARKL